jgi:GNAT superfamily N-acetyltransferase
MRQREHLDEATVASSVTFRAEAIRPLALFAAPQTSLPLGELLPEQARRLPRYAVFPACLVGRPAVDQQFRGQGLGAAPIVDAVARAIRAEPAIFALIVDAKDEAALGFYEHLGFHRFASRPMSLYLPLADAARRLQSSNKP